MSLYFDLLVAMAAGVTEEEFCSGLCGKTYHLSSRLSQDTRDRMRVARWARMATRPSSDGCCTGPNVWCMLTQPFTSGDNSYTRNWRVKSVGISIFSDLYLLALLICLFTY